MGGLGFSVLVTRTRPGAQATATRLNGLGYVARLGPVLEIRQSSLAGPALEGVQAVIATSAAGIAAMAGLPGVDGLPLFCFSGASVMAAQKHNPGADRYEHSGNAQGLSQLVVEHVSPKNGAVLWVRGRHVAFDIKVALMTHGFEVRTWEAYEAHPVKTLKPKIITAIGKGQIKAVLFHSARGARTFAGLIEKNGLSLDGVTAFAISKNAARPLKALGFSAIHTAQSPSEDAMLLLLQAKVPAGQN